MVRKFSWAVSFALATSAVASQACSPLPPPPPPEPQGTYESDDEYTARISAHDFKMQYAENLSKARSTGYNAGYEAGLWETAPTIVLAEVVAKGMTPEVEGVPFGRMPQTTFKVVTVAKGKPAKGSFNMTYKAITSCGPVGLTKVVNGKIGDQFVFFARDQKLGMDSVISGLSRSAIQNYRSQELFKNNK